MEKIQVPRSDCDMHRQMENDPKLNCKNPNENYYKHDVYQNHGDNEVNAVINKKQAYQQRPKTEAEEGSHVAYMGGKALQFTPEMIRDQELLVTTMSQQNMPEAMIRRQFERLLEEQSKQLITHSDSKRPETVSMEKRRKPEAINPAYYVPAEKAQNNCCPAETCKTQLNFTPVNAYQHPNQQKNLCHIQKNHQHHQQNTQQPHQQIPNQNQHQQQLQQQNQYQNQQNSQQQAQHQNHYHNHQNSQQHVQQQDQYQNQQNTLQQHQYQNQCQHPHDQEHKQQQYQNQCQQQQQQQSVEEKAPEANKNSPHKVEPVSLLKLRQTKITQTRNNGLQDIETAHEIIRTYKAKNKPTPREDECLVKLDGINDRGHIEPMLRQMLTPREELDRRHKQQILANGLERDPNQPVPVRQSFVKRPNTDDTAVVYPRQRIQDYPRYPPEAYQHNWGDHQHANEHHQEHPVGQTQHTQETSSMENPDTHQQQQQQEQQGNQNCWKFCPEIQEPRVIGGVTYLARKPYCIPNCTGFLSGNYTNNDHSKSTAAF